MKLLATSKVTTVYDLMCFYSQLTLVLLVFILHLYKRKNLAHHSSINTEIIYCTFITKSDVSNHMALCQTIKLLGPNTHNILGNMTTSPDKNKINYNHIICIHEKIAFKRKGKKQRK